MVLDFHAAMGLPVGHPKRPQFSRAPLRLSLLMEELSELASAVAADDLVEAADALADLEYILLGTAIEWGIDLGPVFEEVHVSNMRKVGGPMRADGKKLKPPGWTPPDVAGVLERQRGR